MDSNKHPNYNQPIQTDSSSSSDSELENVVETSTTTDDNCTKINSKTISGEDLVNIRMMSGRAIADHSTNHHRETINDGATTTSIKLTGQLTTCVPATTSSLTATSNIEPIASTSKILDETQTSSSSVANISPNCNSINNNNAKMIAKTSKLKFLILGSERVGKTLLLRRMQNINWPLIMSTNYDQYTPTTGPDLHRLKCGSIEAIDIGGKECYMARARKYCELFQIFIIVFDVNDAETFLMARYWLDFLQTNSLINVKYKLLIGNKIDLDKSQRKVSSKMAKNLALTFDAEYLESSVKMDLTMDKIFEKLDNAQQKLKQ